VAASTRKKVSAARSKVFIRSAAMVWFLASVLAALQRGMEQVTAPMSVFNTPTSFIDQINIE
jgi:hypothetical protein